MNMSKAYFEPFETSMTELFWEYNNSLKLLKALNPLFHNAEKWPNIL